MNKSASASYLGRRRKAGKASSTSRHLRNAAASSEQFSTRTSAVSPRVPSPVPPHSPHAQDGLDINHVENSRSSRSYGSSQAHERPHRDQRVLSYGTRRAYSYGGRSVRSYGQRRVFSYGMRQGHRQGDGDRRSRLYGRERRRVVLNGRSEAGKWLGNWFKASELDRISSGVGALWVAGHFLNSFARNLNFSNLPAALISKYRRAGSEHKNLLQAQAVWKSIPAQVRAGGPKALGKFHQGKSWSHIIARSRGGRSTADNAIWWSHEKNNALGPNPMSLADIANAKAVLRSDAIRAAVTQTASGMARGAMMAVVVGGALACLECGLDYAEGKITKRELAQRVARAGVSDGGGALFTTGIIVGLSLLFPFLIPVLTPVLFVLQGASLALLGARGVKLARAWWAVLERRNSPVYSSFEQGAKAIHRRATGLHAMAKRNISRSGTSPISQAQDLPFGKTRKHAPGKTTRGQESNRPARSPKGWLKAKREARSRRMAHDRRTTDQPTMETAI